MHNESFLPEKVPLNVPEMTIGTMVFVNCKEHPMFLEQGKIVEKSHIQYRVELVSTNEKLTGKCIWFPEHWIEPLPKEMSCEKSKKNNHM